MSNYVIAYRGGEKPASPEAGAAHMEKWKAWLGELGDAVVNPGTPLGKSKIVSATSVADDDGSNPWSGFSIVKAENLDAAVEIAKACPFLETGGTLEVAPVMNM